MVLQPISSKLPNFLNALIPEEQEADQRKWYEVLTNLQETLRYVSTYLFKVKISINIFLIKIFFKLSSTYRPIYLLNYYLCIFYRLKNLPLNKCKIIMFLVKVNCSCEIVCCLHLRNYFYLQPSSINVI